MSSSARSEPPDVAAFVDALWRREAARVIGALVSWTSDLWLAEDVAHDALERALATWPSAGIPHNPGAWLTTVAKRKAIDRLRRAHNLQDKHGELARQADDLRRNEVYSLPAPSDPDAINDDVLQLLCAACHPVLPPPAQIALTLRVVGGLSTDEIARAFMVPTATIAQRIVRAKQTIKAAGVRFEIPDRTEFEPRLASILHVIYLIFNEGFLPTSGGAWTRRDLADEAVRLAHLMARLAPRHQDTHALVALLEFQSSRFNARVDASGEPITLDRQDRSLWDADAIERGNAALMRADSLGSGRRAYALQAAIAQCHAQAPAADATDWRRIVSLYDALVLVAPSPIVDLNRAVAVAMAHGPQAGLDAVEVLITRGDLHRESSLFSVRAELLARLGQRQQAAEQFDVAAGLARHERERAYLRGRASDARLTPSASGGQSQTE